MTSEMSDREIAAELTRLGQDLSGEAVDSGLLLGSGDVAERHADQRGGFTLSQPVDDQPVRGCTDDALQLIEVGGFPCVVGEHPTSVPQSMSAKGATESCACASTATQTRNGAGARNASRPSHTAMSAKVVTVNSVKRWLVSDMYEMPDDYDNPLAGVVAYVDHLAAVAEAEQRVTERWQEIARIDRENARAEEFKITSALALEAIRDAYELGQRDARLRHERLHRKSGD